MLSLNLDELYITIKYWKFKNNNNEKKESENEEYSKNELNEICPNINCKKFIIRKFLNKTD